MSGDRKKIMFYVPEETQIKFKLRCQHDGLTQSDFLRIAVDAYTSGDDSIFNLVQSKKEEMSLQGKNKIRKLRVENSKKNNNTKKFALDETEVESIFDIIEMETNL
tara:strand:- start:530 stop:847 length:318 start_codon:yes stop_codon:yes gene_type:complete